MMTVTGIEHDHIAYLRAEGSSVLQRFDLVSETWISSVNVAFGTTVPRAITVDDDGIFVSYGRTVRRYALDGSGGTSIYTAPLQVTALHTDGNLLFMNYSVYGAGAKAALVSMDKATNTVIDVTDSEFDAVTNSAIAPRSNRIFGSTDGPFELPRFTSVEYDDAGHFISGMTAEATENDYMQILGVFPGENRVFDTFSGEIHDATTLEFVGNYCRLDEQLGDVVFLDNGSINLRGNRLILFSPDYLPLKSVNLPTGFVWLFKNDTKVFAVRPWAGGATGFQAWPVPLTDLGPPTPVPQVNPDGLSYIPSSVDLMAGGDLLVWSNENKSVFRWSPESHSYTDSVPLFDAPRYTTYSPTTNLGFVVYLSGLITKLDFNQADPIEQPIAKVLGQIDGIEAADDFLFAEEFIGGSIDSMRVFDSAGNLVDFRSPADHSHLFVWSSANQRLYFGESRMEALEINANGTAYPGEPPGGMGNVIWGDPFTPLRVSPDGATIISSAGTFADGQTLEAQFASLANSITDAAWLGSDLYTIRSISGMTEYQRWGLPSYELLDSLQTHGAPVALLPLADAKLLGVTTAAGVPYFTILDKDLVPLAPNHAPQFDTSGTPAVPTVPEGTTNPGSILVSDLLAGKVFDPNPNSQQGIAVFTTTGGGAWQFSVNSGAWQDLGSVSPTAARLFSATDDTRLRFVPATDFAGQAQLQFRAWDQTEGTVLGTLDLTGKVDGYHSVSIGAETLTATVTNINDAPVLNTSPLTLSSVVEDTTNPAGALVSSLVGGVSDVDTNALKGIAVSGVNNTGGRWQYTLNGTTWVDFGAPTRSAARLLPSNSTARVRFLPAANANGTSNFYFFAWDQTQGTAGGVVNLSPAGTTGGATAFSTAVVSASITVTPVNDAPVLNTSVPVVLDAVVEDTASPAGTLVSSLVGGATDADAGALQGIAVSGVTNAGGKWQYSFDGTAWSNFFAPTRSSARLLAADSTTRVRFLPNPNFNGSSNLFFFSWDRTTGFAGSVVNLTTAGKTGGATAYSNAAVQGSISITPVQDAPVLNASVPVTLDPILEDPTSDGGTPVSSLLVGAVDPDAGALQGVAVSGVSNSGGKWQYTRDAGATWTDFLAPTRSAARLLPADASTRVRFVPSANFNGTTSLFFFAWDQTQGTAGGTVDLTAAGTTGGATAFSTAAVQGFLNIAPVDDAPVLGGISGSVGYTLGSAAVVVAPAATVNDTDSADFDTGELVVRITDGAAAENFLELSGFTIGPDDAVLQGSTQVGTRTSDGVGTNDLRIVLNANATLSVVQQLFRSVTFRATATTGSRTLLFSVSDGDGETSAEASKTVVVS